MIVNEGGVGEQKGCHMAHERLPMEVVERRQAEVDEEGDEEEHAGHNEAVGDQLEVTRLLGLLSGASERETQKRHNLVAQPLKAVILPVHQLELRRGFRQKQLSTICHEECIRRQ